MLDLSHLLDGDLAGDAVYKPKSGGPYVSCRAHVGKRMRETRERVAGEFAELRCAASVVTDPQPGDVFEVAGEAWTVISSESWGNSGGMRVLPVRLGGSPSLRRAG